MQICVCLMNFHIWLHPLIHNDDEYYSKVMETMFKVNETMIKKKE
jgi:hypothetical protein